MKRLIMLALLGLSLAVGPAFGADTATQKAATPAKAVKVNSGTRTLDEKGRFHNLHAKKAKLDCDDCHGGGADDILFLRTGEFQGKGGPVDRKECLVCHQTPKKPGFYGTAK